MKKWGLLAFIVLLINSYTQSSNNNTAIKWLSWDEMVKLHKKKKKKIFIDIYTKWCGWCKYMDANVFSNKEVAEVINKHFYPVKLDAEMKDTIYFNGYTFVNPAPHIPRTAHQLAYSLLDGRLAYPSVVFLDEDFKRLHVLAGAQSPENLINIALYFGLDKYKQQDFQQFIEQQKNRQQNTK